MKPQTVFHSGDSYLHVYSSALGNVLPQFPRLQNKAAVRMRICVRSQFGSFLLEVNLWISCSSDSSLKIIPGLVRFWLFSVLSLLYLPS